MRVSRKAATSRLGKIVAGFSVLLGLAAAWAAFEVGQVRGGHNRMAAFEREAELLGELTQTRQLNDELKERVALLETDSKVKAEAYRQVEQRLSALQSRIQKQDEDIAFYQGIVGDQQSGLRVQDFGLFPSAAGDNISLRLVLAQALRDGRRIKGTVEVAVAGERDGQSEVLGLDELGVDGPKTLNFSFRYFQNLGADLALPADFLPETVTVRIRPSSKGVEPVEASFDWKLQRG
jgi:hypothetical protein